MGKIDDFLKLVQDGKVEEAQAMIRENMAKEEFHPDEIIQKPGRPAVFKNHGRLVKPDKDGNWKLKIPPRRKRRAF